MSSANVSSCSHPQLASGSHWCHSRIWSESHDAFICHCEMRGCLPGLFLEQIRTSSGRSRCMHEHRVTPALSTYVQFVGNSRLPSEACASSVKIFVCRSVVCGTIDSIT